MCTTLSYNNKCFGEEKRRKEQRERDRRVEGRKNGEREKGRKNDSYIKGFLSPPHPSQLFYQKLNNFLLQHFFFAVPKLYLLVT